MSAVWRLASRLVSRRPSRLNISRVSKAETSEKKQIYTPFSHLRALAHTISRLFSLWLTMVLTDKLRMLRRGISFGALLSLSLNGLTHFGEGTLTSSLHQDA